MESLERFVMLATSNDITRVQLDHGHVSATATASKYSDTVAKLLLASCCSKCVSSYLVHSNQG